MNSYSNVENSVIPYGVEEIDKVLKQMLHEKGITDVLYEGSNVSQLSSVISYIIGTLQINTAANLQETLLPLATKRMNVLFGARQLGYEASQRISYTYDLLLKAEYDEDDIGPDGDYRSGTTERTIPLNHNTEFVCGEYNYYYVGPTIPDFWIVSNALITDADAVQPQYQGSYDAVYKTITVKEGQIHNWETDDLLRINAEEYNDENGNRQIKQHYLLPYKNVEENGIIVYTTYVDENGILREREQRFKTDQYLIDENMNIDNNLYTRVQNIILGMPEIFFELGGFGTPIRRGTLIEVELLTSNGTEGEAIGKFKVNQDEINVGFDVVSYTLNTKGQTEESIDSIKENALVYHNTANRAVTRYDFIAILKRHPLVKEGHAWGGEEEKPKEKGHIWISAIPATQTKLYKYFKSGTTQTFDLQIGQPNYNPAEAPFEYMPNLTNWYMTPDTIENGEVVVKGQQTILKEHFDPYKMMTMEMHYRHPLYVDFDFECDIVKYDVSRSTEDINKSVFGVLKNYFENDIEKFDVEYINSNLQRVLDKYLTFNSGIAYNIKVQGALCREMIDEFNLNLKYLETFECPVRPNRRVIKCSLAFPFENIFKDDLAVSKLDTNLVPRIDTEFFGASSLPLTVEYDNLTAGGPNINTDYMTCDIYYGDRLFGEYAVNRHTNSIDLTFEFAPDYDDGKHYITPDEVFGMLGTDTSYMYFDIVYPYSTPKSTSIPFTKNTIPRLRTVSFIDN